MAELSTGEFAKLHQCTLKHVNAKMKKLEIPGRKSDLDKRLTILTDDEQAQLEPYINANRKQTEPEPIADVVGELIDDEPIEPSKNTALTFHVADQDAEILAIRQDTSAIATQTKSNFSAFQAAQIEKIRARARRDAGEVVNAYQAEYQAVLNEDLTMVYGIDAVKPTTPSATLKKLVGQS